MALQKKKRGFCDFQSPHLQAFREPRISLRKSSDDHFGAKHSRGSDKACTENDFIRRVKGFAGVAKASRTSSVANARDSSQKFRNSGHVQFVRDHLQPKPLVSARERTADEKLGHEANAWHCMKPRGSEGKTGCSAALQRAAIERTGLRQRDGGVVRAEGLSSQKASTGRKPDAAQLSWDVKEGMCTEEDEDEQRPRPIFASERRRLQELSNSRPHAGGSGHPSRIDRGLAGRGAPGPTSIISCCLLLRHMLVMLFQHYM